MPLIVKTPKLKNFQVGRAVTSSTKPTPHQASRRATSLCISTIGVCYVDHGTMTAILFHHEKHRTKITGVQGRSSGRGTWIKGGSRKVQSFKHWVTKVYAIPLDLIKSVHQYTRHFDVELKPYTAV